MIYRILSKYLEQIQSLSDKDIPGCVIGDFDVPSHREWTEKAARSGRHPIKVVYPTSLAPAKAGSADAFRTIYPDEMENSGQTRWKTPATHGRLS